MKLKHIILQLIILVFFSCKKEDSQVNPTNGKTTVKFNENLTYGAMTDQEGNIYKTITIGTQTWMAENLRTTMYNDGSAIPNITDGAKWDTLTTGAYCNYNNLVNYDSIATFGRLYNWYAVQTGKLAPAGWHVPTSEDWLALVNYLGGSTNGGKLKETGTLHWNSPNTGATNATGFTAIAAGDRGYHDAAFDTRGNGALFWTSTPIDGDEGYNVDLRYNSSVLSASMGAKYLGFSVRLIKNSSK